MPPIIDDFLERTEQIWHPVYSYLKAGTTVGAVIFVIMVSLFTLRLFTNVIPSVIDIARAPVVITGEDILQTEITSERQYRLEADSVILLEEDSNTPLRTANRYWGVYELDDFYVYVTSNNTDMLSSNAPQRVTGRLLPINRSALTTISNDAVNIPGTVLPFVYQPYNPFGGLIGALFGLLLSGFFVAVSWYFHHMSVLRNGGHVPFAWMNDLHAQMRPLGEKIQELQLWIAKKLMSQMGGSSIGNIVQQTDSRSRPRNDDGGHPTITIDPSKIRKDD